MAKLLSGFNMWRPFFDRRPVGDFGFALLAANGLVLSLAMRPSQAFYQFTPVRRVPVVDELIDGLVADGLARVVQSQPPRYLLGRPA